MRSRRRRKAFYVEGEYRTIIPHEHEDGRISCSVGTRRARQIVTSARGPQHAEQMAQESWPDESLTVEQVLPVRHRQLAERMLEGDWHNPDWEYEQGLIEEEAERWQREQEPGR